MTELAEYPPLLQKLLLRRGIETREAAHAFLNPDFDAHTHDPFLIKNMERAVERILKGIKERERIIVFTDYDTDGIPAGVVLYDFFTKIGYENFTNYIPHRHIEGYGLNMGAVEAFAAEGATLMITADCGISNVAEVKRAQELGIDVILSDHHLPHEELPPAYAILNSKQEDDEYPFDMLCGCAVAWKLVCALLKRGRELKMFDVHEGWEKWLLDMVGISTIADMVPLHGENRVLATYGIRVLRKSPREGLQLLLKKLRVDQRRITEEDIGFAIGPRINAASRMDVPRRAFELLSTRDAVQADELSDHLNKLNDKRKKIVAQMMREAHERLDAGVPSVIVMGNPTWLPGVLGLAANRLAEEYDRPTFLWGRGEESDMIKGSCRSDGRVNIVELMGAAREHFADFGGHEFSGGFSVAPDKIHFLEEALIAAHAGVPKKEAIDDQAIDAELTIAELTWETYRMIAKLAPFGEGNPRPLFRFADARIAAVRWFGKEKEHIALGLVDANGRGIEAIKFFARGANEFATLAPGTPADIVGYLEENAFGRRMPELRIRIERLD